MPGDTRPAYPYGAQARQILNDAEDDLREWQPELSDEDADIVQANTVGHNGEHANGNHRNSDSSVRSAGVQADESAVTSGSGAVESRLERTLSVESSRGCP